jgi:hypothetical protein
MKLFIREILPPSVEKAIFVDTNAFFLTDPAHRWRVLATLPPGAAFAVPMHPNTADPLWHDASTICSCVLLDLRTLRAAALMDSTAYRAAGRTALARADRHIATASRAGTGNLLGGPALERHGVLAAPRPPMAHDGRAPRCVQVALTERARPGRARFALHGCASRDDRRRGGRLVRG